MSDFFLPSVIDSHASSFRTDGRERNFAGMFSTEALDSSAAKNARRTAKRLCVSNTVLYDDFSHPLAKEGGFWGINKDSGHQVLRRYDPKSEPIDLTGDL